MTKFRITLAALLFSGVSVFAGTRMDIVNAPCKNISEALAYTLQQNNKPFSIGASGEDAFDNPGLISYTFKKLGVDVPTEMVELLNLGKKITKIGKMQAGDIVFFSNPMNKKEVVKMGLVQSVSPDGLSFTFFYADQQKGVVRIVHSTENEFNGHFKQANRIVTDTDISEVRGEHQKTIENIKRAEDKLLKAQEALKEAENNLVDLKTNFERRNAENFLLK